MPADASEDAVAALRARAQAARELAEKLDPGTKSFGDVARTHSRDQASRYKGGDIGWLTRGARSTRWDPAVVEAIFSLSRAGEISPVLQTETGFHVARLMETRASSLRPLQEVQATIRNVLLARKRERLQQSLYDEMRSAASIEIDTAVLESIALPAAAEHRPRPPPLPPSR